MPDTKYSIVYCRPDGWWSAGDGFASREEAADAAQNHAWRGATWGVVDSSLLYYDGEEDAYLLRREHWPKKDIAP